MAQQEQKILFLILGWTVPLICMCTWLYTFGSIAACRRVSHSSTSQSVCVIFTGHLIKLSQRLSTEPLQFTTASRLQHCEAASWIWLFHLITSHGSLELIVLFEKIQLTNINWYLVTWYYSCGIIFIPLKTSLYTSPVHSNVPASNIKIVFSSVFQIHF